MESTSTAAWAGPYELQLAKNWTAEEVAPADDAQVWVPAVGHPFQYGFIAGDIFGSSGSLQPYVVPASSYSSSGGQQQLVEYNYYNYGYAAAAQHHNPDPVETSTDPDILAAYMNSPEKLFQETKKEFKDDARLMKTKMHRYPPSIQALGSWYTEPKVVAIGPYYHGQDHLQKAEKMKHVAAAYCIQESSLSVQDMYDAVVSVAAEMDAYNLYDKDVVAGISYKDDFLPMMFYDACFLAVYILSKEGYNFDDELCNFFASNDKDFIAHDIMLLENQIPLQVVDAVMNMCKAEPQERMKMFIARWLDDGFLLDQVQSELPRVDWDTDYYYNQAPHLLGLIRFNAVGKRSSSSKLPDVEKVESIPISAGAIELAEMGIFLRANETTKLPDMGLARKWIILKNLTMAPLSLNELRASWLVSMAALELCTTLDFVDDEAGCEDSAVCSYLLLLSMLMHREEDVHELRTKGILQGAGLNDSKTLDFFTTLQQSLRIGRSYALVMVEISGYRNKRRYIIAVYAFLCNNWKYIVAVVSAIRGFIGIITALMELKGAH